MDKALPPELDLLPDAFEALTAAGAIWETNSIVEDETLIDGVTVAVNQLGESITYFAVAKDIVTALQPIAQQQGVSTQTLINLWLQEKLWQLGQ